MSSTDLVSAAEALLRVLDAEGLDFEEMRALRVALAEKMVPYYILPHSPIDWANIIKPGTIVEVS